MPSLASQVTLLYARGAGVNRLLAGDVRLHGRVLQPVRQVCDRAQSETLPVSRRKTERTKRTKMKPAWQMLAIRAVT